MPGYCAILPVFLHSRHGLSSSSIAADSPAAPPPSRLREAWATAPPIRGGAEDTLDSEGGEREESVGEERLRAGGEEVNPLLRPYDTTENSKAMCASVRVCVRVYAAACWSHVSSLLPAVICCVFLLFAVFSIV